MTSKDLIQLQKSGKIRGFKMQHEKRSGNVAPENQPGYIQKQWIFHNVAIWCNDHSLILHDEHKFDQNGRRWKFDWCIPALKIGIEYEGLPFMGKKSRHTTKHGFTKDVEKYTSAGAQGYIVLRYTCNDYKNILNDLKKLYEEKNSARQFQNAGINQPGRQPTKESKVRGN